MVKSILSIFFLIILSISGLCQKFVAPGKNNQIIDVEVSKTSWQDLDDILIGFDVGNLYYEQDLILGAGCNAAYYLNDKIKFLSSFVFPYGPEYETDRERLIDLDSSLVFDPWHFRRLDGVVAFTLYKKQGKRNVLLRLQTKLGKSFVKPRFRPSLESHTRISFRTGYNMYQTSMSGANVIDTSASSYQILATGIRTHSIIGGVEVAFLQTANYHTERTGLLKTKYNLTILADLIYGFSSQVQQSSFNLQTDVFTVIGKYKSEVFSPLGFRLGFEWLRSRARMSFLDYKFGLEAGYRPIPRILPLQPYTYHPIEQFFINFRFGFVFGYNLQQ